MERTKLSRGLRLLSTGHIVGLVGVLGLLGSMLMMVQPLLSDRLYHSIGLLRLSMLLVLVTGIAAIVGTVIDLVAQVKLRGEHPDYHKALVLTLVGLGVNFLLSLLKQEGLWVDLVKLVVPCLTIYLTIRATNEFLTARGREYLVRRGWIALTVNLTLAPLGVFFARGLEQLMAMRRPADSAWLVFLASAMTVTMSLVQSILVITYLRRAAEALEQPAPEEPAFTPEIE